MHYEIFKYCTAEELLNIRALKLGGYQLTSNILLRSRITNYFKDLKPIWPEKQKITGRELKLIVEQSGNKLVLSGKFIGYKGMINLATLIPYIPEVLEINLSIYIYI